MRQETELQTGNLFISQTHRAYIKCGKNCDDDLLQMEFIEIQLERCDFIIFLAATKTLSHFIVGLKLQNKI